MATVRVESEAETERGWEFRILVDGPGGAARILIVSLSWVDYSYWSPAGAATPEKIAATVVGYVCEHWDRRQGAGPSRSFGASPDLLPERFDAATARRWFPELDAVLQRQL